MTMTEMMDALSASIVAKYEIGHEMTNEEIVKEMRDEEKKCNDEKHKNIKPSDYCYNRWNKGINEYWPCFFESVAKGKYRVWGKGYPFNGKVLAHPRGGEEHVVGQCINGKRTIWPKAVYPDELPDNSPEHVEGGKKQVTVNAYEREPKARKECIDEYGAICFICKFDFGEVYGADFEGMIHVHHLKMLSKAGGKYVVDPIKDLRPVCPNCHMVLHSKKDCYSIEEVQKMLNK